MVRTMLNPTPTTSQNRHPVVEHSPYLAPCTVLCGRSPHDIEWQEVGNVAITEDLLGKRASREDGSSGHE
jgi:hypothetical protein